MTKTEPRTERHAEGGAPDVDVITDVVAYLKESGAGADLNGADVTLLGKRIVPVHCEGHGYRRSI